LPGAVWKVRAADFGNVGGGLRVRTLRASDLARVQMLENLSSPVPWTPDVFESCQGPRHIFLVLESAGRVEGFAVANEAAGEAHLLNVAIHPGCRGQGLGVWLLTCLFHRLALRRVAMVFLEVRCSNLPAIGLYLRFGFEPIGIRKAYYARPGGREDALAMSGVMAVLGARGSGPLRQSR
jgi:[ribosomal protein S18]-alanine N-acetyltransferase